MARKTETRQIGGMDVTCTQFEAIAAFKLSARIGKVLAPALLAAGGKIDLKADVATLAPVARALFDALDPEQAESMLVDILRGTSVVRDDGTGKLIKIDLSSPKWINAAFDGDLGAMLSAAAFALEVNLGSFFGGSGPSAAPTPTPSP